MATIPGPNVRRVVLPILEKHKLPWELVTSRRRKAPIVACRHEIFAELKRELRWSASRIARLCGRDHTTVIYALRKYRKADAHDVDGGDDRHSHIDMQERLAVTSGRPSSGGEYGQEIRL